MLRYVTSAVHMVDHGACTEFGRYGRPRGVEMLNLPCETRLGHSHAHAHVHADPRRLPRSHDHARTPVHARAHRLVMLYATA